MGVLKAVFSVSFGAIMIWLYSLNPSTNENMALPAAESISKSMFGSGNSSFRQALLRFLKSTEHLIYPFFFFTGTMLDNQRGCWIGLMNLMASNFLDLHNYLPFYLSVEYPGMLKFSATKYSMDKHSALLKFSRFCCEQSAEGSALWLLKLSATKYSANEHSAFLGFSRFRCEQSTKGFALLKKVC